MIHHFKIVFIGSMFLTFLSGQASGSDETIYHDQNVGSINMGAEVNSGDYGTANRTTGVYVPLVLTWFPTSRIDLGIEIPFVYQKTSYVNDGTTQTIVPVTIRGGVRGGRGTTTTSYSTSTATTGTSDVSASGIGDLVFRFGVIAYFESDNIPQLRPSVYVKAPTASDSDGLGTGELDAGAGIEASKWIGDTHLTGEVFYNYLGKVPGIELRNYVNYTAGIGYQITDKLQPMLLGKGSTPTYSGSDGLLELRLRMLWSITESTTLDVFVSRGLSESSPEYGGGAAVIYSF